MSSTSARSTACGVVILGQDPYPDPRFYYGICFSVPDGLPVPGSLQNIFREIHDDTGRPVPASGRLERWVVQGVLPMNSILTVRAFRSGSHRDRGWEMFTDAVIRRLNDEREHLVFMLWGSYAQRKGAIIDPSRHLVLSAAHPSPRSADRGFFGCRHFSRANDYLRQHGNPRNRVVIPGIIPFLPFLSVQTFFLGVPGTVTFRGFRGVFGFPRRSGQCRLPSRPGCPGDGYRRNTTIPFGTARSPS